MGTPAEKLPGIQQEQLIDLRLVHSVETPNAISELVSYGTGLVESFQDMANHTDLPSDIREMTTAVAAGGLFEDYALPPNFPTLYDAADRLVRLGETDSEYLEELEQVYERFGGYEEAIEAQHPLVYLLRRLMSRVRNNNNPYLRDIFIGTYRRTLVMADSLL